MGKYIKKYTFSLFARPSFREGFGRIFDFHSNLNKYNTSRSPKQADVKALYLDWQAVGQDLRLALDEIGV